MQTADLDYVLPAEAIAQQPVEPRDAARLLVHRPGRPLGHRIVRDLPALLRPGDLMVVNDTRVVPARLHARRATGGAVEILLLEPLDDDQHRWEALVRPSAKVGEGEVVAVGPGLAVAVGERRPDATRAVTLLTESEPLAALARYGETPLPPYLTAGLDDPERYQTVYARRPASAAAPTAGLHLTTALLDALAASDIGLARVELVVGLDTFRPISVDDPAEHHMHSERFAVPAEVIERCHATRAGGGRVVAIGTTSARALESAALGPLTGRTELFIRRPYDFRLVDVLLTNFHLPRTTLLLMIDALVGPVWRDLYTEALREGYRFLSFGDAMLLERS